MKITRLEVSNILRIKAAEVTPQGALVMVAGRNDQGKTSLLNSIALALSGKDLPVQPIRAGAASGYVLMETDDIVVVRSFSQTGGSKLEVRDKDGARVTSPQTKLDALVSRVTFDPFEFTRMKAEDQLKTVRNIAGLDFSGLDNEYRTKYDQRTDVNRKVRDQDGKLKSIVRTPDVPADEYNIEAIADDLEKAQAVNKANDAVREELANYNDDIDAAQTKVTSAREAVAAAEQALLAAREKLTESEAEVIECTSRRDAHKEKAAKLEDAPLLAIMERLKTADTTNQKIRENKRWTAEHKELLRLQGESGALTERLEAIQKEKEKALATAKFPVQGLGFSETGVTFNDIPFEQASSSGKIRVSVAIARALNPALPVMFIRDGSLLDEDSLAILASEAEETGCQIWMEIVGSRDDATVIIEDGEVIATPSADKKKKAQAQ